MQQTYGLHKVIEYREIAEHWCREAYLDARTARLEIQTQLCASEQRKVRMLESPITSAEESLAMENRLRQLDEEELKLRTFLRVLEENEKRLHAEWTMKLRDLQALQLLSLTADGAVEPVISRDEQTEMAKWSAQRQAS